LLESLLMRLLHCLDKQGKKSHDKSLQLDIEFRQWNSDFTNITVHPIDLSSGDEI